LYKGAEYLNEIYDKNGKLRVPIFGFVNPLSGLYPLDYDSNKVYELLTYQKIPFDILFVKFVKLLPYL